MKQVVAILVINPTTGSLVLARRLSHMYHGCWDTPGGKIRDGETALVAAQRELREEAQLELPLERLEYWGKAAVLEVPCIMHYWAVYLRPDEVMHQAEPDKHHPWMELPPKEVWERATQGYLTIMPSLRSPGIIDRYLDKYARRAQA